jgi:ribosome-associated protein
MNEKKNVLKGKDLAETAAKLADSIKAERISLIELKGSSDVTDWFVICQGDNTAHVRAIADAVVDGLKNGKTSVWHAEGLVEGRWIVLDYSDVVVHVMLSDVREYYAIEELWPKAKVRRIEFSEDTSHVS